MRSSIQTTASIAGGNSIILPFLLMDKMYNKEDVPTLPRFKGSGAQRPEVEAGDGAAATDGRPIDEGAT